MHCKYVLLSLLVKAEWPVAKQDFRGTENDGKKGRVLGVTSRSRRKKDEHTVLKEGFATCQRVGKKFKI